MAVEASISFDEKGYLERDRAEELMGFVVEHSPPEAYRRSKWSALSQLT